MPVQPVYLPLIIHGSARPDGDTQQLVEQVLAGVPHTLINLRDYSIAAYNYPHDYPTEDAFLHLIELMLRHPVIVFATPVYWYSMSGIMKNFFDRLTDLVEEPHKPLGRQLAGKHAFLLAAGSDEEWPEGFEVPFRRTAEYFDMSYEGSLYHSSKHPFPTEAARRFAQHISRCSQPTQ
ncbi:flavodoxin family protein [Hymenobacter wooponensis]|uniref:NADPH-dependent oxidoreductase n=1 Tax=Hymenobacter wooponensis TaxID=1525360 RepID=A0A4Z0MJW1_9BACT|nr:NAD(P)H-dependent oxidoreductase [Hymenobacter wooponensis]TGD79854.1 NADPH-dependent oxidoreductase [Hymenobacter wooponensis]